MLHLMTGPDVVPHGVSIHMQDMDRFKGQIIPARMLCDKSLLKDKRVLVLGGGKTSCAPFSCACQSLCWDGSRAHACQKLPNAGLSHFHFTMYPMLQH